MADRGFLLSPTYRIVAGRPEVRLFAVLESGEPALILDDRARPYLFVRARDEAVALRLAEARASRTALTTFDGERVLRIEADTPEDLVRLRERLAEEGAEALEADVRFAYRFLIDRGIRAAFSVEGPFSRHPEIGRIYRNPHLRPARFVPRLSVLSLDIETSLDGEELYSIATAGAGGDRVFLIRAPGSAPLSPQPFPVEHFPDERALLTAFFAHLRRADPDILTGWSLPDFDLPAIQRFSRRARLRCALGRAEGDISIRRDPGFTREARAFVPGRVVLDGLALLRGAFVRLPDYRLETAARTLLGKGKLFGPDGHGNRIEAAFRDAPDALAAYNLEDARLVLEILERLHLVELTVERSLSTGMQLDRVGAQIAAIDSLYLGELRMRGLVAPSVAAGDDDAPPEPIVGGLLLEARPGLYRNVLVYDFKSLYPSLIRSFNIDPMTFVGVDVPEGVIRTPGGACFRRDVRGVLPDLVARLLEERAEARRAGDERRAQATKILMNSFFGVLGTPASRLFSPAVANAITLSGQHVIRRAAEAVIAAGHRVLYGDTDSLFVDVGEPDPDRAAAHAEGLRLHISETVARDVESRFGAKSHLELEFEKMYARFLVPEPRGAGGEGSKKRYAGLVAGGEVEIVGLEAIRRDTSAVAQRFQRELFARIFHDEPLAPFIRAFVTDLCAGKYDAELVIRKALRKPLGAYTKTTPPHVKAARRLGAEPGREISYVITLHGPEPATAQTAPPDHQHYVTRELKPIADAVLHILGSADFDEITGARRQLCLFPC
jgi:DNA polymerase-2